MPTPNPLLTESKPDLLGGAPVFPGTRVPIATLFDYLEGGRPLGEFLDDFPTVKREQTLALLRDAMLRA